MNTTTSTAPVRSSFIRLIDTKYVKNLVKEAKRVEYTVNVLRSSAIYGYEVYDPTHDNSVVFKAMLVRPNYWAATFSKVYWQEPV